VASHINIQQEIVINKLAVLDGLIATVEKINDNKMGPLWHPDNIRLLNNFIDQMKSLDKDGPAAANNNRIANLDIKTKLSFDIFRRKLLKAKQLIAIYMAKIEGSKSLLQDEISRINKAKLIRGYRFRSQSSESAGQLC
jgi:hypothetical protein